MAADPTLKHSVTTNRFYRIVSGTYSFASALTAISDPSTASSVLNGVNGHMATVRTANDNVYRLAIGCCTRNGCLDWGDDSARRRCLALVWMVQLPPSSFGRANIPGMHLVETHPNWSANEPNNYNGDEDYAQLYASNGKWNDLGVGSANLGYVVEWAADDVLDTTNALTYSIVSQTLSGAFAVNSDNGTIEQLPFQPLITQSTTSPQTVTVRVTDSSGLYYDKTLTISLTMSTKPRPLHRMEQAQLHQFPWPKTRRQSPQ